MPTKGTARLRENQQRAGHPRCGYRSVHFDLFQLRRIVLILLATHGEALPIMRCQE